MSDPIPETPALGSRWGVGVIVALGLVHLLTVTPYLEGERRTAGLGAERARLEGLAPEVEALGAELVAAREEAATALAGGLERLVQGVSRDLDRLDDARGALERTAAAAEAGPFADPPAAAAAPPGGLAFDFGDPERIADVREAAGDRYALLAALEPVVEERILAPRFAEVERLYASDVEPRLEARLEALAGALERLRRDFPEGELDAGSLSAALEAARAAARGLELEPPPEPYWWASPEGSPFALGLDPADEERLLRPPVVAALEGELERAAALQGALAGRLERVVEAWAAERERAERSDELGLFLRRLGVDPRALALDFPLVLGLVLAGLLAAGAGRFAGLRALAVWVAAVGWIAAAAYQVQAFEILEPRRRLVPAVLAVALVTAAALYRLTRRRLAAGPAADVSPPGRPVPAEEAPADRLPSEEGLPLEDPPPREPPMPSTADRESGFLDAPLRR